MHPTQRCDDIAGCEHLRSLIPLGGEHVCIQRALRQPRGSQTAGDGRQYQIDVRLRAEGAPAGSRNTFQIMHESLIWVEMILGTRNLC